MASQVCRLTGGPCPSKWMKRPTRSAGMDRLTEGGDERLKHCRVDVVWRVQADAIHQRAPALLEHGRHFGDLAVHRERRENLVIDQIAQTVPATGFDPPAEFGLQPIPSVQVEH